MKPPWELYYEIAVAQVESQERQWQNLDTKAQRVTAAAVAITTLLVTFLKTVGLIIDDPAWLAVPAIAVATLLMISAILMGIGVWVREYTPGPRLDWLGDRARSTEAKDAFLSHDSAILMRRVGTALQNAYADNEGVLNLKAILLRWNTNATLGVLAVSLFMVATALFPAVFGTNVVFTGCK